MFDILGCESFHGHQPEFRHMTRRGPEVFSTRFRHAQTSRALTTLLYYLGCASRPLLGSEITQSTDTTFSLSAIFTLIPCYMPPFLDSGQHRTVLFANFFIAIVLWGLFVFPQKTLYLFVFLYVFVFAPSLNVYYLLGYILRTYNGIMQSQQIVCAIHIGDYHQLISNRS